MDQSMSSQSSSGVAANSFTSASASSSQTAATSFSGLADTTGSSQHSQPVDNSELFNDPFTGVPSSPPDAARLFFLCQSDPRACSYSIPSSLFFLYCYASPWQDDSRKVRKQYPRGARQFILDCERDLRIPTYTRLYTEWLFSGGAPSSLAKLHRHADGSTSVSFSGKVRACIYVFRLYQQRKLPFGRSCNQVASIFGQETTPEVSEEYWNNVVISTEKPEIPCNVWNHVYPTPAVSRSSLPASPRGPSTVVQTEPFRGVVSLLPDLPDDVPDEWTLWTPMTVPAHQSFARKRAYDMQSLKNLECGSSKVAMPLHELDVYRMRQAGSQNTRFSSPDVLAGAEEEEYYAGASSNASALTQISRNQLIQRLPQPPQYNTPAPEDPAAPKRGVGRPRKSTATAPTKAPARPTRLRLIASPRPSTPEQAAAFEEAMDNHSPAYAYSNEFPDVQMHEIEGSSPPDSKEFNETSYEIALMECSKVVKACKARGLDVYGIGVRRLAEESVLFVRSDWK
ncbi:unnamed protein product [Aureobasidium uvarum]|uniref:Uncharacterized protein n=1 Tax=Aureobasidium uvarum TaxID=2773716 RepID=A0A9N8PPW8_9PEZI|nr:unnamed protein product [Aureobasidium uvarum]